MPVDPPPRSLLLLAILAGALATSPATAAVPAEYGRIEVLRDSWGIPHLFSTTDAGAFYGLGQVTAEEHGFQMTYALRIIQGRLAEILGDRPRPGRRDTTVDSDRKMRTLGWDRAARETAAHLDPDTQALLQAYCRGVNDSFADQKAAGTLHPLFTTLGVEPEEWTPADCLLSWWHLGQFFATDGTRDLIAWRTHNHPIPGRPQPPTSRPSWADDTTAVVQRGDVDEDWLRRVSDFARRWNPAPSTGNEDAPKFSHAWVVGGRRTTTGAAVLVSDPQTPVRNPSLWVEFHVCGPTLNARGIGVAGSPGLLIGFNETVAWGLTALGADQADLFRLETSPDHPDAYLWDEVWRPMTVRTERLRVRGGEDLSLTIRDTHLGPVASAFCFRQAGEPEVALKRIPLCERDRDTIQAVFAMMRAPDAHALSQALQGWRFPSANCLFGDAAGNVGYRVLGAIPVRSSQAPDPNGGQAGPGTREAHDWQGFVPAELLPHVLNPSAGALFSGNHRPVAAFYPIPLGLSTGSMGDSIRSWRLRERLAAQDRFTPEEVLAVHYDTVNPARREIVRLGLHLQAHQPESLSPAARQALQVLEPWFKAGASSDLRAEGAELATRISTFFRFVATPLALTFGGGESGLARFLKDAAQRMERDPGASFGEDEQRFVDRVLSDAWNASRPTADRGRSGRPSEGRATAAAQRKLGWFDSLDGFGSLDPSEDLLSPGITCLDGQTILSQASQSYTQWVPLHDVDAALAVCPIGHSDRPDGRYRTSTLDLWRDAKLHPAPLHRPAVERHLHTLRILAP